MSQDIAEKRKKSVVILTTHSMEEAEALCSRIAIQVCVCRFIERIKKKEKVEAEKQDGDWASKLQVQCISLF